MGEAVTITSGKGGVGKSTLAANLAVALVARGATVALIDCDTGLRSLDVLLGLEDRIVYDACDVADGVCRLKQALLRHPDYEGLSFIAAAQTRESGAITPLQLEKLATKLKETHDWVLLDCPAGLGRGFRSCVAAADLAILVVTPDAVSVRSAERAAGLIELTGLPKPRLIVNRARYASRSDPFAPEALAERLYAKLLGVIPEEAAIERAARDGRPLASGTRSRAARAFHVAAARLCGEDARITPVKRHIEFR